MLATMEAARIATLLEPFLGATPPPAKLVAQLQTYLDLLLRWNARMNLTAVRDPEHIVGRHFGESLFAARVLRDAGAFASRSGLSPTLADVGSGAGFPGIPIKLAVPEVGLTLIESQNKKGTFLREVIRILDLDGAEVFFGRAERWNLPADIVTLRAVEKFERALPAAATLVGQGGCLCLLLGAEQVKSVGKALGGGWQILSPTPVPESRNRVVLIGFRRF
jgi:16S rRNA (guanine527-N7)-methyltransferase